MEITTKLSKHSDPSTIPGQQITEVREYSSKEVKKFLETYGDQPYTPQIYLSFHTIMGLQIDSTAKLHGIERKYLERWFRYEHLITDRTLFWGLCYQMWHNGGSPDERWLDVFSRYDRLDLHIKERLKYFCVGTSMKGEKYTLDFFERRSNKIPITVYRGFKVRKGKAVRKGAKKVDNEDAYFLDEGRGFSFSLSKSFPIFFISPHYNDYFYKKYAGVTDPYEIRLLRTQYSTGGPKYYQGDETVPEDWLGRDCYCVLGTFTIRKSDIIGVIMDRGEEEIICDPNSVRLERYEFLTFADGLAAQVLISLKRYYDDRYGTKIYWHKQNENKLLKKAKEFTSTYYKDPDKIKRHLLLDPSDKDNDEWFKALDDGFDCDISSGIMSVKKHTFSLSNT